jgi:Flp pilus assembly protein TadG
LAEFALLVPLFLLMLVGMFEFGRAWNVYQVVVNAAREGGRVAALPTGFADADSVTTRITNYLTSAHLDPAVAQLSLDEVEGGPGTIASVSVSYPYEFRFVGPIARLIVPSSTLGGDLLLSSTAEMRNE